MGKTLLGLPKKVIGNAADWNSLEKTVFYTMGIVGAITPAVAARYALYPNESGSVLNEILSWTGALLFSGFSFPISLASAYYGGKAGWKTANYCYGKRKDRESHKAIEEMTNGLYENTERSFTKIIETPSKIDKHGN